MSMAERKIMTRAVKNPVKRKLTRAEKKEIAAVIQAAKGDGKPHTAQQTIPYLQMYPDGICRVTEKKYSKSLVFEDINYQLAQADDKTAIFENWCDFLNYFDASVSVQLSFINQGARKEKAQAAIEIPAQDDAFNSIRREYADMLKNQLEKGNNGLEKCKYITFSIEADNLAAAKARLSRIETDVLNNFKVLGAAARPMNGQEVYKFAVRTVPKVIAGAVEAAGLSMDEIDFFLLHQANLRIIEAVAKRLHQPMEKFPTNLQKYGNISSASVPILLDNVNNHGMIGEGSKIVLAGFGAGLTWGAAVLRWQAV